MQTGLCEAAIFDYESNVVFSIHVRVMDDDFEMISDTFVVQVIDEEEHTSNESPEFECNCTSFNF